MINLATGDDSPLRQGAGTGSRLVFVDTEACDGGTSGLGSPRGFLEYSTIYRAKRGYGRPPGWAQPTPWWVVPPSRHPQGAALAQQVSSGPEKSTKSFAAFGLRLILISCDVKKMQKIAIGTGHYVNRLVPK